MELCRMFMGTVWCTDGDNSLDRGAYPLPSTMVVWT
jgi:hypothetical protein